MRTGSPSDTIPWRPDGQYILIAMWVHPHPEVRRSLYIASRDGKEMRWLTHFGHHHSWTADGSDVLFNGRAEAGARMHRIDFNGENRRVVFDQPIGSHPLMHPDGTAIMDSDAEGIYAVRLDGNRVECLASFSKAFEGTHHGTHAHPVWNRDGSAILDNSAESGHREVYCISMEDGVGST